jgi:probable rRNA maturation factor
MSISKRNREAILRECDCDAAVGERDGLAIDNRQRAVRLARRPLESFLRRVQNEAGFQRAGVTVCLVSDAEIARLNETFRKKKGPTDVLSFPTVARRRPKRPASEGGPYGRRKAGEYLGDIAISPSTARRYAKKNGRKLAHEIRVLILHGVLHLLGYDHESDRGQMDRVERKLRKRLGLAR